MAVHVSKANSGRKRISSWALGGILSLVLVGLWALFLVFAPAPTPRPEPAPAPSVAAQPPGTLRMLVWRGMMPPEILADFEADTGIKVAVDTYRTLDELQALASGGALTQDLLLVSGIGLKRLADADLLSDLSATPLANGGNLDTVITARAATYDPGGHHGIVAAWGSLGLAFDAAKLTERLGDGVAFDSWALLFDADRVAKLADCGVQIVDTPRGAFPIALRYLGLEPESGTVEDTEYATRLWEGIRPFITKFTAADVVDNLASGQTCLALATSGDAFQARAKAAAAASDADLRYVIPEEGSVAWFAMLAVPRAAANADGARRLIDYLLRPEVAARVTNVTGFANAVAASPLYIRPEVKNDATLMPPDDQVATFMVETDLSPEVGALRDRFWQLINTPQTPAPPAAVPPPADLAPEKPAQ